MKKIAELKALFNKDITETLKKRKIPLIAGLVVFLLACVGMFFTYAYYQVTDTTPIIGGSTGDIADIEFRVMAEQRDTNGNGLGAYEQYPYIPQAGYRYNAEKSYCTNGSSINYDPNTFSADVTAYGTDLCYLYFDSTANLDLTLNVYAENINSDGRGTGQYTKLETTALPAIGYVLNTEKSKCSNGSELSYNADENMFTVNATEKDVCDAYMDAIDVDIQLKLYVETKAGSGNYYETNSIPTNAFYELDSQSSCTGAANQDALSIQNQKVVIAAASKTSCVAYLKVSSGPMLESMQTSVDGQSVTINLGNSNLGTNPITYYYSSDNGATYVSSTSNSYTFSNLTPMSVYTFKAYSVDASGKTSGILTTTAETDYVFNGVYDYKNAAQVKEIEVSGYYKLQVWGAQGGYRTNSSYAGLGGYSEGTVYLNKGDIIYVYTGGAGGSGSSGCGTTTCAGGFNGGGSRYKYYGGGGGTDIRINTDSLYARVIVAGGGGSDGATNKGGGYGGGTTGQARTESYGSGGYAGTQTGVSSSSWQTTTVPTSTTTQAGAYAGFGFGGNGIFRSSGYGGAGGGGWYGGSGTYPDTSSDDDRGGGGGSGYVYTESTAVNYPAGCLLNSNYYLVNASTHAGNTAFESTTGGTETGHSGNGYAKVTYIGTSL